ncbi:MAG: right-handed parallel beta-helix repeat-containing protein, partial [Deltaproteobacteria bacterium]|nr:right-handed parallel beta-helix repeat-containing protein [Deltaproteobacteria bacterium]
MRKTYVVSPTGHDSNAGTMAKPWKSIAKANGSLLPGDTVQIRAGTYHEMIAPARSGVEGRTIVYENFPGEVPKVVGNSALDDVATLNSRAYIVLKGLHMYHAKRDKVGQSMVVSILYEGAHHNVVLNCNISSPDKIPLMTKRTEVTYRETGIVVGSKAHHNLLQGNTIENMTKIGIHLTKAPRFTRIIGNRVLNPYQDCIHHGSGNGIIVGTLIENNILGGSVISDGVQFNANYDAADPKVDTSNRGTIIRNNIIYGHAENAIDLKGTSNIVVDGNIIYGIT